MPIQTQHPENIVSRPILTAQIAKQKAQFKNLVHNGVDFYVQNALKLTYEHL